MHDLTNCFFIQVCTFHSDSGITQASIIAPRAVERIKRLCGLSGIFLSRSFRIRLLSAAVFLKCIEISNLRHTVAGAFTVNESLLPSSMSPALHSSCAVTSASMRSVAQTITVRESVS